MTPLYQPHETGGWSPPCLPTRVIWASNSQPKLAACYGVPSGVSFGRNLGMESTWHLQFGVCLQTFWREILLNKTCPLLKPTGSRFLCAHHFWNPRESSRHHEDPQIWVSWPLHPTLLAVLVGHASSESASQNHGLDIRFSEGIPETLLMCLFFKRKGADFFWGAIFFWDNRKV